MFLKLVKSARMTWRKRLWEVGGVYSYPINKHFLYVSMSICSPCSSATTWFHFWSLPTLTKPHTQCHVGHFSHTASQAQPLIFSKARSPCLLTSEYATYTKSWGSTVSPYNLLLHCPHCWSNLNIPCCCSIPTHLPYHGCGKQMASFHYASALQISEGCYHHLCFPIMFSFH